MVRQRSATPLSPVQIWVAPPKKTVSRWGYRFSFLWGAIRFELRSAAHISIAIGNAKRVIDVFGNEYSIIIIEPEREWKVILSFDFYVAFLPKQARISLNSLALFFLKFKNGKTD